MKMFIRQRKLFMNLKIVIKKSNLRVHVANIPEPKDTTCPQKMPVMRAVVIRDPALSLLGAGALAGPSIIGHATQYPCARAYNAIFTNLNHVPLKSHPGGILGSSEAISRKVIQNINLPTVTIHSLNPVSNMHIGIYCPIVSKILKINIIKVTKYG